MKNNLLTEQQKLEEEISRAKFDQETQYLQQLLQQREKQRQQWNQNRADGSQVNVVEDRARQEESLFRKANQLALMLDKEEEMQVYLVTSFGSITENVSFGSFRKIQKIG